MTKKLIITLLLIIGVLLLVGIYLVKPTKDEVKEEVYFDETKPDVKNMIYDVEGTIFELKNGEAEYKFSEDSETTNSLVIFGEPVYGDVDKDGDEDTALWLVNDPGGTGKFYYAVLVLNNGDVYKTTNTVFLGDRIAPQTLEIKPEGVVYNFAERSPEDPMTAEPSVAKSVWIKLDKQKGEIGI
jgi:hypothetical protein